MEATLQECRACSGSGTTGRDCFGKPTGTCNVCGGKGEHLPWDDIAGEAWAVCPFSGCGAPRLFKRMYGCGTVAMGEPVTGMIINPGGDCDGDKLRFDHEKITVGKKLTKAGPNNAY